MRTRWLMLLVIGALLSLNSATLAQNELQKALNDTDIAAHWIYDDLPKAMAKAKEENKPILVVLRCVPCPPGSTLDKQVMMPKGELEKLEKQFVCVRVVQTNGLDLKVFQYDYDQSWAAMVLNADGTIYGRYGTRTASGPKSDWHLSAASFQTAMQRALDLHKGYPANKKLLEGKVGKEPDYAVPEKTPGLTNRPPKATTKQTCIHCHMVREYALRAKWEAGKLTREDLFVYPMPDNIGLSMDGDDGLKVKAVAEGSHAAMAGLAAGDDLVTLNGQALISLADVQWALHTTPVEARVAVTLKRKGQMLEKTLELSGNWKQSDIAWRASSWYGLRQGLKLEPLSAAEKKNRGLNAEDLALAVKGLHGQGGPKVQRAGLRMNDVIVAVDGKSAAMTESEFLVNLRLNHGPKDTLKVTILRGQERQELMIPLW